MISAVRRGRPLRQLATHSPVAIDIGHRAVRAIQLRRHGGAWTVARAVCIDTGAEAGGVERSDVVSASAALKRAGFRGRRAAACISAPDCDVHSLELAGVEEFFGPVQEAAAAGEEIQRLMRFDRGAVETAHWRIPRGTGTNTTAIGVAAPKPLLATIYEMCRGAGFDCVRIDAAVCALARAGGAVLGARGEERRVWGVLDIGARAARLVVCSDELPVLVRSFETGGQRLSDRIAQALGISSRAAEIHKKDFGMSWSADRDHGRHGETDPGVGTAAVLTEEIGGRVFRAIRADLDRVEGEITRSFQYVLSCFPPGKASQLILAGGGAGLKGLDLYLAERLGIDVTPFARLVERADGTIQIAPGCMRRPEDLSGYAAAIGLAIDA